MEQADQLCRRLHSFLAGKLPIRWLIQHGWFDFVNTDRPRTDDPIELACAAFLHLSSDEDDNWNEVINVLIGVVAFLKDTTGFVPTTSQLRSLKKHLCARPLEPGTIHRWFAEVYSRLAR